MAINIPEGTRSGSEQDEDRQWTYNATFRHVRITIVAVKQQ